MQVDPRMTLTQRDETSKLKVRAPILNSNNSPTTSDHSSQSGILHHCQKLKFKSRM